MLSMSVMVHGTIVYFVFFFNDTATTEIYTLSLHYALPISVSARTKQGIPELLEYIALQSEVLELKSNPEALASGRVVEAKLEKGRGPVATVLVEEGTLRVGDALVTGIHYGRVRAMMN